jgi:DNA-binding GntR family transcriptional regulator
VSRAESDPGGTSAVSPVVAAGLAERVYQLLKAEVINNQFGAEERIVIETVAVRLGVSPTPVREALARLAGEELVSFRVYVGYAALPPLSRAELSDLFEAREVIECAGAVRSCERATDADLESLREIDARIRAGVYGKDRYSDFVSFVNDNQRFHQTLLDAARNPALRRAFDALNYEARMARRTQGRGVPDLELICNEHTAIISALARRDAAALVAAVTAHARDSHRRLVEDMDRVASERTVASATPAR